MPVVLEMFAHHLPLSASWLPFTEMLAGADAKLSARDRELVILRVAWRTRSGYEWAQHSRMGADAGLTAAQIDAMAEGPAAAVWTPLDRALLTAVDEIIDEHAVGDGTWDALAAEFDGAQMFELLFLIGGYLCLAGVLNSIGLRGELPPPWMHQRSERRRAISSTAGPDAQYCSSPGAISRLTSSIRGPPALR